MFTFLGKVADELEAPLLKIQSKKGEEFYGFYGVLDADYKNNVNVFSFYKRRECQHGSGMLVSLMQNF
jgi:hypothetical protein